MPSGQTEVLYRRCNVCSVVIRTSEAQLSEPYSVASYHSQHCSGSLKPMSGCHATIFHGPGHQSSSRCQLNERHDIHATHVGNDRLCWRGVEACTGFGDESPLEDVS
jgi:hypothetical protein